jgi:hypothetical protein
MTAVNEYDDGWLWQEREREREKKMRKKQKQNILVTKHELEAHSV